MAEGKKISELKEYAGGLSQAMNYDAKFPVADRNGGNMKVGVAEIGELVESKMAEIRQFVESKIKEAIDGIDIGNGSIAFDGDSMQLVKGNGSFTPGFAEFRHKLDGIYKLLSPYKDVVGFMVQMSEDKKVAFILGASHCTGRVSFKVAYRNSISEDFFSDSSWKDFVDLKDLSDVQTSLVAELGKKVAANSAITPGQKTKISYDAKGLVTGGTDLTAADIPALPASKITSGQFTNDRLPDVIGTWETVTIERVATSTQSLYDTSLRVNSKLRLCIMHFNVQISQNISGVNDILYIPIAYKPIATAYAALARADNNSAAVIAINPANEVSGGRLGVRPFTPISGTLAAARWNGQATWVY